MNRATFTEITQQQHNPAYQRIQCSCRPNKLCLIIKAATPCTLYFMISNDILARPELLTYESIHRWGGKGSWNLRFCSNKLGVV